MERRTTRPSISLPVLPAIRGRVIDTEGRPVPDAAVGRWLTFDADGTGEMLPFFDGAVAAHRPRREFRDRPHAGA